jgi:hypothetical protein
VVRLEGRHLGAGAHPAGDLCLHARTDLGALAAGGGRRYFRGRRLPAGQRTGHGLLFGLLALALIWLLRKESFAYTHYPMRFNRKTRTVHVFRPNGTVLSVPWDQLYFTLGHMAQ